MTTAESYAIDELTSRTLCEHFGFSRLPFPKCIRPEHTFPASQFAAALGRYRRDVPRGMQNAGAASDLSPGSRKGRCIPIERV